MQLDCREFFPCNAGLIWLVAADRITNRYFHALFNYVTTMCVHNLWKMLTQQKVQNMKMKIDQNKLHYENKMAVIDGTCGWSFDVVLIVLNVLELLKEVSCKLIYTYPSGFPSLGDFINKGSLTDCVNQTVPYWFTCTKLRNLRIFWSEVNFCFS